MTSIEADSNSAFQPTEADKSIAELAPLDSNLRIEMHKRMLLARRFEERMQNEYNEGRVPGGLMLSIGQEAVGAGVGIALEADDIVRSWVRGNSQAIGRGMPLRLLCAEIMGKVTGGMKGRGGAQFLAWREGAYIGGCSVVGSVLPVAAGHAMAQKLMNKDSVTCVFFGEGALHIGLTHEALNFAGVWKLPAIFVCEDNGYALSAPWKTQTAGAKPASRGAMYGLRGIAVDGNDAEAVYRATREARDAALDGEPTLIEARTYRLAPFSTGETGALGAYVPAEERRLGWEQDPLLRSKLRLAEDLLLQPGDEEKWEAEVADAIEDALRFADKSPYPNPTELLEGVLD